MKIILIEDLPRYKIGESIVHKKGDIYVLEQIIKAYLPKDSMDWEYWIGDMWVRQSEVIDGVNLLTN